MDLFIKSNKNVLLDFHSSKRKISALNNNFSESKKKKFFIFFYFKYIVYILGIILKQKMKYV